MGDNIENKTNKRKSITKKKEGVGENKENKTRLRMEGRGN